MRLKTRAVPIVIAAVAFVVVAVAMAASGALREQVRTLFVVPIVQGFYIIRRYVDRLPQLVVWIVPLLLVVVLPARAMFGRPSQSEHRRRPHHDQPEKGDLARLARQIHRSRLSRFARVHIARRLFEVAIRLMARRTGVSLDEARSTLRAGSWEACEGVGSFLVPQRHYGRTQADFLARLERALSFS